MKLWICGDAIECFALLKILKILKLFGVRTQSVAKFIAWTQPAVRRPSRCPDDKLKMIPKLANMPEKAEAAEKLEKD